MPLIRERFDGQLDRHPLRREIIATGAVNYVVNKAGIRLLSNWIATLTSD